MAPDAGVDWTMVERGYCSAGASTDVVVALVLRRKRHSCLGVPIPVVRIGSVRDSSSDHSSSLSSVVVPWYERCMQRIHGRIHVLPACQKTPSSVSRNAAAGFCV